jgi:hypothetical protein
MTESAVAEKNMLSRKSPEVVAYIQMVEKAKLDAEVVTLRDWYDSTTNHQQEIIDYMEAFKQLGRLGKELHNRGVVRVTERFGNNVRTLVEATYQRGVLNMAAPLCAFVCTSNKK